jgi:response regulator NasT
VAEVGSGREAVRRTQEVGPDVVLLDVHMPDGSGIEAAEEITRQVPGTAVVLFSGDEAVALSDREVTATSAVAFLPKPTPVRVLDATIRLAVTRARELASARKDAVAARQQLENRKIIERAKGILMRRTGSSEQEAYRILQRTSQDRSVPMVTIAKAVLDSEPGAQQTASNASPAGGAAGVSVPVGPVVPVVPVVRCQCAGGAGPSSGAGAGSATQPGTQSGTQRTQ